MAVEDDMAEGGFAPYGDMTEEEILELVRLGIIPAEIAQAESDMLRGQEAYDEGAPSGRSVNQGRTYIASNPLEHISRGIRGYQGRKQEDEARITADLLRKEQVSGRNKFLMAKNKKRDQKNPASPGINPMSNMLRGEETLDWQDISTSGAKAYPYGG